MKKSALLSALVLVSVSSLSFAGSLHSLGKAQVLDALQNTTITTISVITLNGKIVNNTFTGYLGKNGQMFGQLTNAPTNGDPQSDQGTWQVKPNGVTCVTWQHWNQGRPVCLYVYDAQNSLIFVNATTGKFESMVLNDNIKDGNQMQNAGQMQGTGQMQQGTGQMQNGMMPNSQMQSGQMQNGQMPNSQMQNGTMQNGQMPNDQMQNGTMQNGNGQMPNGQTPNSQMQNGTMQNGNGQMQNGQMQNNPNQQLPQLPSTY